MSDDRRPLVELANEDLLRQAEKYRAMAAIASTITDRDGLNRVAVGFERIVERRNLAQRGHR